MPETHHLPVHGGMPSPATSSDPAVLTTIHAVEAFLAGTPFASTSITDLTGGTANYAYRIHLATPLNDSEPTVVLKHAQPYVKTWTDLSFEVTRQTIEVEAMTRVKAWHSPTSLVTVPKIYHFDPHNKLIIMEDCGPDTVTLKEFLRSGKASPPGLAESIGTSLGEFIAAMHDWSRSNPDGILDVFEKSVQAKKLSAWVTYGRLIDTLDNTTKDVPPKLLDPPLEVDASDIQVVAKIADEVQADMTSARDVFVMGDFWPGNIMVKLGSDQQLRHLYILDWEIAKTGIPGVELGQFCAEMHLLTRFDDIAREPASVVLSSFLNAYACTSKPDHRLARDTLAHWGGHLIILTPRLPWGDKPSTREVVKEGVKFLVGSRKQDFLAQSVAKPLLPK